MKDPKRRFGQVTRMRSGRYQARYSDPNGATTVTRGGRTVPVLHTASRTFLTRRDAEDWLSQQHRLIRSGEWRSPAEQAAEAEARETSRRNRTFETYARAWLEGRHDLRATTRQSYETSLRRHLIPAFGDQPIDEITVMDVRTWFAAYGKRTPAARAHAYQVLGAIMRQAEDDEVIPRSPVRVKAGGKARVSREPQVLSRAELLALADAMPPQHKALTLVAGMCGLRFGELVALRLKDVDLEKRQLHVNRAAYRAGGKKDTGPPKTAAGKRSVTMPASVASALAQHLKDYRRGRAIMTQNVVLSVALIALLPLALFGVLGLAAVVLVHEVAEVIVIANGLRAIRTQRHSQPEARIDDYSARQQRPSMIGTR